MRKPMKIGETLIHDEGRFIVRKIESGYVGMRVEHFEFLKAKQLEHIIAAHDTREAIERKRKVGLADGIGMAPRKRGQVKKLELENELARGWLTKRWV